MPEMSDVTESLCPHCLKRIPARRIVQGNAVYLDKACPDHGPLDPTIIWKNDTIPYHDWRRPGAETIASPSCDLDCGICGSHLQSTCSVVLEVTARCDLSCPICFAGSGRKCAADPDLHALSRMLKTVLDSSGACPVQLSGGEPTMRDDLPEIVALARKLGFDHIQINTNGIRLGQDPDFGRRLKDAGATTVFLQLDTLSEDVCKTIRGAGLVDIKKEAIARCADLRIGVILVPTILRGVNDREIGDLIRFATQWIPTVKGVHFQPMAYLGRYPASPCNENRILIPDILAAIEIQTSGELSAENFIPPG